MITLRHASVGKAKRINRASSSREFIMEGFLEPGLVSYEDSGDGISRLDKPAIDKMLPTFVGCPLVIEHVEESKDEVLNGKTDKEGKPLKVGEVTRAWWNADTGKFDCAFTVEDDRAKQLIENEGWSGSCAYNVREPLGPSGELHAMRYDNTILDGVFEHLALVSNPRYEDCTIRMNGKAAKIKDNAMPEDRQKLYDEFIASSEPVKNIRRAVSFLRMKGKSPDEAEHIVRSWELRGLIENAGKIEVGTSVSFFDFRENKDKTGVVTSVDGRELMVKTVDGKTSIVMKGDVKGVYNGKQEDRQSMFDKERAQHPSFTDEQIWQIVEDHIKIGENMKDNGRAGNFSKGQVVTDINGVRCTIVGEAASGEYYVVKYADGSTDRMRELDLNNSKENSSGFHVEVIPDNYGTQFYYVFDGNNKKASAGYKTKAEAEAEAKESERRMNASREVMKSGNKCDIVALQDKFELVDKRGNRIMYADNLGIVKDAFTEYEATGNWNTKENAGLDQPFGSTLSFESNHLKHKGYQIEQVGENKWKVWKGSRFLATLGSVEEAKSFIDQKKNSTVTLKNSARTVVLSTKKP